MAGLFALLGSHGPRAAADLNLLMRNVLVAIALVLEAAVSTGAAEPKRLLVISATTGFRHPSIENGEKLIQQLAEQSGGEFTAVFISAASHYPKHPLPIRGGAGRGAAGVFPGTVPDASPDQLKAL